MKRNIWVSLLLLMSVLSSAQTQQGYVKTKGRLGNNGSVIAGTRLSGATVTVKGGNAVLSGNNGTFSLSLPNNNSFFLQNVQKQGYVLTDPDVLSKQYAYSKNPLVLVLETPDQQTDDRLAAERKIRKTLQRQLQEREDEIEALKEQNKLSEEEYRKQLQDIYDQQESNEKLISEMAERYSKTDFDLVDDFNRRISDCIINGRLTEADSLLNTKGDINSRAAQLRQHQETNAQVEQEIKKKQKKLEKSKAMTQKELEELAQDCYSKFEIFKIKHQNDSAAHYIELRASLDTANIEWQLYVSRYLREYVGNYKMAYEWGLKSLQRAIFLYGKKSRIVEKCYTELGMAHEGMGDYISALHDYTESLKICEHIYGSIHPDVAVRHADIGMIYSNMGKYKEANIEYNKALMIVDTVKQNFEEKSFIYNGLGLLYENLEKYEEALNNQKKALDADTAFYGLKHPNLVTRYNNLGTVHYGLGDFDAALTYFNKALDLAKTLYVDTHPAVATALNNIGVIHYSNKEYSNALTYFNQVLSVRLNILDEKHPDVAATYLNIGNAYSGLEQYEESEKFLRKSLDIKSIVYGEDNPELSGGYNSLGMTLLKQKKYSQAQSYFEKALKIRINTYGNRSPKVSLCYGNLGRLYKEIGEKNKAIKYFNNAISSLPDNHPNVEILKKEIDDMLE